MMKNLKIMSLLLGGLLVLGTLTACGGDDDETPPPVPTSVEITLPGKAGLNIVPV